MDEGGEVEDFVVKGEERKKRKGFFCPALIPNGKYNSLRCRFCFSDFFFDAHVTSRGFSMPDEAIRLQLLLFYFISPGELKGSISPGASSPVYRAGKS